MSRKNIVTAVIGIKAFLDKNPRNGISTATLAEMAGVSRNVLQDVFKQQFGTDIGEYKLQLRMKEAKTLLINGKSVKAAAIDLHYASPSAFTNAFRNYFDITPSDFIKTLNNGHGHK